MYSLSKFNFNHRRVLFQISKLFESTIISHFPKENNLNKNGQNINKSHKQIDTWSLRETLSKPTIQRNESLPLKVYYSPEWEQAHENPLKKFGITPEKWEYYNKVVWPKNYVVPETGLPKPKEVFHCRESIHYNTKRMWRCCHLVHRMNVIEAIKQLKHKQIKGTLMLAEVIEEAMERAKKEFCIADPTNMFVAEAFPIQSEIIKGKRRHAKDKWAIIRYRYIHLFVRLEENNNPKWQGRAHNPNSWELMERYYEYLRNRNIKYFI